MTQNYISITRLYTGKDNESHFENVDIPVTSAGKIGALSQSVSATGMIFRTMPGDYDMDWHTTETRQYVVILEGAVEMEVGSGDKRLFTQGDIILSDDKTGRGHKSRSVNGVERTSLFITLE